MLFRVRMSYFICNFAVQKRSGIAAACVCNALKEYIQFVIQQGDERQTSLNIHIHKMSYLLTNSVLQDGRYQILGILGQGGFGITYLARQTILGRKVAIKEFFMKELCDRNEATSQVILGTKACRETVDRFREKFIKEAQSIAAMSHPNIVRIIDVFEENGTAYYVMDYLANGSLLDMVNRQGALAEDAGKEYILQIAGALEYVHQRSMNHLDVKPSNIMISDSGEAILIDFGLSKQYDAETGGQTSATPVGISEGFAPMEQYKQGGVGEFSPQTDIYALGATLFKLLTGQTPPSASDITEDGVPVDMLRTRGVSQDTINVILKAMETRKKDRMQTMREFITALQGKAPGVVPLANAEATVYPSGQTVMGGASAPKASVTPIAPRKVAVPPAPRPPKSEGGGGAKYAIIVLILLIIAGGVAGFFVYNSSYSWDGFDADDDSYDDEDEEVTVVEEPTDDDEDYDVAVVDSAVADTDDTYGKVVSDASDVYVVTLNMFVRTGPGAEYDAKYSPYNDIYSNNTNGVVVFEGTPVEVLDVQNGFARVRQLSPNNDRDNWGEGWVSTSYLERR